MRWRNVALIGVGLLGGSLGLALRRRGLADHVRGYVRRRESTEECVVAGAVELASTDLEEVVAGADLVVFCTPLSQMLPLAKELAPKLGKGAIVTDVGSVKGSVVRELEPIFSATDSTFVGSHPMAGSEKVGVKAARADLFENSCCVVTPTASTPSEALREVEHLWSSVGGRLLRIAPDLHDELVSRSSHLPHVIAAHLASYVLDSHFPAEQARLCANGFKDSTRIASGSPEMWRDIISANQGPVSRALDDFIGRLQEFSLVLEKGDPAAIESFFRSAKSQRDEWAKHCVSTSPE